MIVVIVIISSRKFGKLSMPQKLVLKIGLLISLTFFIDHPSDQSELIGFSYSFQNDATRENVEIHDMEVCVNCHEEIHPASSMTSHATNCNGVSSRANFNSDIEKNVAFENLQEIFPHIVVEDEIMQVLEITDTKMTLTSLWKLIAAKLQEKNWILL